MDKEAAQVAEIVESIRKKKTFKQLVTYNIQLLEKAVAVGKDRCVLFMPRRRRPFVKEALGAYSCCWC